MISSHSLEKLCFSMWLIQGTII